MSISTGVEKKNDDIFADALETKSALSSVTEDTQLGQESEACLFELPLALMWTLVASNSIQDDQQESNVDAKIQLPKQAAAVARLLWRSGHFGDFQLPTSHHILSFNPMFAIYI